MLKISYIHFLAIALVLTLINISHALSISEVQESRLTSFDKVTIGEAFSNYHYLINQKWSLEKDKDGDDCVIVQGKYLLTNILDNTFIDRIFNHNTQLIDKFLKFLESSGFFANYKGVFKYSNKTLIQSQSVISIGDEFQNDTVHLNRGEYQYILNNRPININYDAKIQNQITFLFYKYIITTNQNKDQISFITLMSYKDKNTNKNSYQLEPRLRPLVIVNLGSYKFDPSIQTITCEAKINVTNILINPKQKMDYAAVLKENRDNLSIIYNISQIFYNHISKSKLLLGSDSGHVALAAKSFSTMNFSSDSGSSFGISIKTTNPLHLEEDRCLISLLLPPEFIMKIKKEANTNNSHPKIILLKEDNTTPNGITTEASTPSLPTTTSVADIAARTGIPVGGIQASLSQANEHINSTPNQPTINSNDTNLIGKIYLNPGYYSTKSTDTPISGVYLNKDGRGYILEIDYIQLDWKTTDGNIDIDLGNGDGIVAKIISPTSFTIDGIKYNLDKNFKAQEYAYTKNGYKGKATVTIESNDTRPQLIVETTNEDNSSSCSIWLSCEKEKNSLICYKPIGDAEGRVEINFNNNGDFDITSSGADDFFCSSGGEFTGKYIKSKNQ